MLLIHMIRRHYGRICILPELTPFGVTFDIHPYIPIPLIYPRKDSAACTDTHTRPVRIMKWIVLKNFWKNKTIPDYFLPFGHILSSSLLFTLSLLLILPAPNRRYTAMQSAAFSSENYSHGRRKPHCPRILSIRRITRSVSLCGISSHSSLPSSMALIHASTSYSYPLICSGTG